ncbi:MAG: PIN domain-containing protein [Candidatus Limnocylindria bacterium]
MNARGVVLDASALVAYARNEPGAEVVAARLRAGEAVTVSSVNWAEVVGKLRQFGLAATVLRQALSAVDARISAFGEPDADATGELAGLPAGLSLSLGDRACIALTLKLGATAVTADRAWREIAVPDLRVDLIR